MCLKHKFHQFPQLTKLIIKWLSTVILLAKKKIKQRLKHTDAEIKMFAFSISTYLIKRFYSILSILTVKLIKSEVDLVNNMLHTNN